MSFPSSRSLITLSLIGTAVASSPAPDTERETRSQTETFDVQVTSARADADGLHDQLVSGDQTLWLDLEQEDQGDRVTLSDDDGGDHWGDWRDWLAFVDSGLFDASSVRTWGGYAKTTTTTYKTCTTTSKPDGTTKTVCVPITVTTTT